MLREMMLESKALVLSVHFPVQGLAKHKIYDYVAKTAKQSIIHHISSRNSILSSKNFSNGILRHRPLIIFTPLFSIIQIPRKHNTSNASPHHL
jgi:hypothetical protein